MTKREWFEAYMQTRKDRIVVKIEIDWIGLVIVLWIAAQLVKEVQSGSL